MPAVEDRDLDESPYSIEEQKRLSDLYLSECLIRIMHKEQLTMANDCIRRIGKALSDCDAGLKMIEGKYKNMSMEEVRRIMNEDRTLV